MLHTPNPLALLRDRAILGHRGNRAHAPENTLFALREAVALGVDGIEFDVHLSRDGQVVVIHDPTLDRTTNATGAVASYSWAELGALDAGAKFTSDGGATYPFRGKGIGVPRLVDVLEAFPTTTMIIEIKEPRASLAVRRIILDHSAADRCTVGAFAHESLTPFDGSGIARGASTREVTAMYLPVLLGRRYRTLAFQSMSLPPVHNGIPLPLGALSRATHDAGVPVYAWTINNPVQAATLWSRGVRGVITDDPGLLLRSRSA